MSAAIVTLALGNEHLAYWRRFCEPSWRAYAARHALDVVVIDAPLDDSPRAAGRSPAWQKCLVLGQPWAERYQRVVWLDSDIVINARRAPSIVAAAGDERMVGGVLSGACLHDDLKLIFLERMKRSVRHDMPPAALWAADQRAFYAPYMLDGSVSSIVQTGVLVASPRAHRAIFERIYHETYPVETRSYEQMPLSHALLSGGWFEALDSRFNAVFYERLVVHYPYLRDRALPNYEQHARLAVATELDNAFFLHFAYDRSFARFLPA